MPRFLYRQKSVPSSCACPCPWWRIGPFSPILGYENEVARHQRLYQQITGGWLLSRSRIPSVDLSEYFGWVQNRPCLPNPSRAAKT